MITYPKPENASPPLGTRFLFALKEHAATIALALWVFIPLVRRLVQLPTSYSTGNALTLVPPFFALGIFFLLRPKMKLIGFVQFAVVCTGFAFLYAFIVGIAMGSLVSSFYTFIDFLAPILIAAVVATPYRDRITSSVEERYFTYLKSVGVVTLIVAIYGIVQYVAPLPWDAKWMTDSQMQSIGQPEPFEVRVFSTLNSPGVLGAYLSLAMLHLIPLIRRAPILAYSTMLLGSITFLLSLLRAGWVAVIGGLFVYFIFSERRFALAKMLAISIAVLAIGTLVLQNTPGFEKPVEVLSQRFASLGDVDHDYSAIDRENQIQEGAENAHANPIGYGLGVFGTVTAINSYDGMNALIDNGFLARLIELGLVGFAGYLAPFIGAAALCFLHFLDSWKPGNTTLSKTDHLALAAGSITALMLLNIFGDFDRGVTSFVGWMAIFFFVSLSTPSTQAPVDKQRA